MAARNVDDIVASVLLNDKILDKLIELVVWSPDYMNTQKDVYRTIQEFDLNCPYANGLITKEAANLRLVNSSWLQATTRVLRKYRDPLFKVGSEIGVVENCMGEGPLSSLRDRYTPKDWNQCLINPFVELMCPRNDKLYVCETGDEGAGWEVPTYRLEFYADYFKQENHENMANLLVKLGSGLVRLRLQFAVDSTMTINLPSFKLPRLKSLVVNCDEVLMNGDKPLMPQEYRRSRRMPVPTRNFQELVEVILTAAAELEEIEFQNISNKLQHYFPSQAFTKIQLPVKLQQLRFQLQDTACLRILLEPHNSSVQLTTLILYQFTSRPYDTDLIYDVLKKFANSLIHFFMIGENSQSISEDERSKIKFPVMTALKTVEMLSGQWTLYRKESSLAEKLPNLENLSLAESTYTVFKSLWTNGSVFKNGNKLSLQLLQKGVNPTVNNRRQRKENTFMNQTYWLHYLPGDCYPNLNCPKVSALYVYITLTPEIIKDVQHHFPSITQLHLSFLESQDTSGLKYIFKEMTNLTRLELVIVRNPEHPKPKHFWDEALIGYPEGLLHDYENFHPSKMVNPSIRNLTKLESLFLSMPMDLSGEGDIFSSVITKCAFQFGFMRIPNLKHLKLAGGFKPSKRMTKEWEELHAEDGGSILYFRTKNMFWDRFQTN